MNGFFKRVRQTAVVQDNGERPDDVSADLPYELQSKMFDQLATVSLAGTGLAITLIGSVLKDGSWQVWLSVIFFGIAAATALTGNIRLIEGTFQRRSVLRRSRVDVSLAIMFIGAGAGFLSMDVYATRKSVSTHATSLPVKGD